MFCVRVRVCVCVCACVGVGERERERERECERVRERACVRGWVCGWVGRWVVRAVALLTKQRICTVHHALSGTLWPVRKINHAVLLVPSSSCWTTAEVAARCSFCVLRSPRSLLERRSLLAHDPDFCNSHRKICIMMYQGIKM